MCSLASHLVHLSRDVHHLDVRLTSLLHDRRECVLLGRNCRLLLVGHHQLHAVAHFRMPHSACRRQSIKADQSSKKKHTYTAPGAMSEARRRPEKRRCPEYCRSMFQIHNRLFTASYVYIHTCTHVLHVRGLKYLSGEF